MIIFARVRKIEHKRSVKSSSKTGDEVFTEYNDLGWGILFDGFWEWWMVGPDKPEFAVGDEVEIEIRRRDVSRET